jgi:hypothetical protein
VDLRVGVDDLKIRKYIFTLPGMEACLPGRQSLILVAVSTWISRFHRM